MEFFHDCDETLFQFFLMHTRLHVFTSSRHHMPLTSHLPFGISPPRQVFVDLRTLQFIYFIVHSARNLHFELDFSVQI